MAKIARVQLEDGRIGRFEVPDDATPEAATSMALAHFKESVQPELSLTDALSQGVSNLPASASKFASGLGEMVSHPIDTAQTLLNAAQGGVQNVLPESINKALADYVPGYDLENKQIASNIGRDYKESYGSWKDIKNTIANDPVRVLSDLSLAAGGAGALAKSGGLAKTANIASKVSNATNPLTLAGKALTGSGRVASTAIGNLGTHTGDLSLKTAESAGFAGGNKLKALTENMRGSVSQEEIVPKLKASLAQMKNDNYQVYLDKMRKLNQSPTVLDFNGIDDAVGRALNKNTYSGLTGTSGVSINTNKAADAVKRSVVKLVDDFRNAPASEFHTAEGLDELKRGIGNIMKKHDYGTPQYSAAKEVYDAVKKEIVKQDPVYSEIMKDSQKAMELTTEIEKSLKLGRKSSADTALRSLQSVMRNNANSNFGSRVKNVEQLGGTGMEELAGQSLNTWTPRGIGGALGGGGTIAASAYSSNPYILGLLPFQSPRLMGEAALKAGQARRVISPLANNKLSKILASTVPAQQINRNKR